MDSVPQWFHNLKELGWSPFVSVLPLYNWTDWFQGSFCSHLQKRELKKKKNNNWFLLLGSRFLFIYFKLLNSLECDSDLFQLILPDGFSPEQCFPNLQLYLPQMRTLRIQQPKHGRKLWSLMGIHSVDLLLHNVILFPGECSPSITVAVQELKRWSLFSS